MFTVTSFIDSEPYLEAFNFLEKYIRRLEEMMDIERNPNHEFMKQNISMALVEHCPMVVGVPNHRKIHDQFCPVFMKTHQEILYLNSNT